MWSYQVSHLELQCARNSLLKSIKYSFFSDTLNTNGQIEPLTMSDGSYLQYRTIYTLNLVTFSTWVNWTLSKINWTFIIKNRQALFKACCISECFLNPVNWTRLPGLMEPITFGYWSLNTVILFNWNFKYSNIRICWPQYQILYSQAPWYLFNPV